MANKSQLPEHKGEEYGVDELKPKIIDNNYEGEAQSEQGECKNEFMDVVEGCLIQLSFLGNKPLQFQVLAVSCGRSKIGIIHLSPFHLLGALNPGSNWGPVNRVVA
ncbi:MAG: hypothetical protein O7F09_02190 [Chloroflexi bacterium]|nr:hypothetical protein [Chloroflexota bacterium]